MKTIIMSNQERLELVKLVIFDIEKGLPKKQIVQNIKYHFLKENTCKSFIASVSCVYKNYRKIIENKPVKKGIVYQHLNYLINGGNKPNCGNNSTIDYCKYVYCAMN